ncbi:energy transducer TonB [Zymomonas mobilis]|uniref:energy transducer TonB n=1 Tax=Zymomonas mobilis TaxID=542 RepID=UPI0039EBE1A0
MAYADQQPMSRRKIVAIGLVVVVHIILIYGMVSGLAVKVYKHATTDLKVFDVKTPPPPPKPPEPPKKEQPKIVQKPTPQPKQTTPPQIVTPPVKVDVPHLEAPAVQTVTSQPVAPMTALAGPIGKGPIGPPSEGKPDGNGQSGGVATAARPHGDQTQWVTQDDYPSRAMRDGKSGTTAIAFTIGTDGRVSQCHVTSSSGTPELDEATCKYFTMRARYYPAKSTSGDPVVSSGVQRIIWRIPDD